MDMNRFARGRRFLSRAALWLEAVWPAVWPGLGVAGLYLAFALFDGPRALPGLARPVLLGTVVLAVLVLLWRGLRGIVRPTRAGADRRLERTSGLRHRPLAVLADRPADGNPAALELWQAHQARTAASLTRLRVGAPHPGLPARDRHALRGAVVVAVVAGLVAAGPDTPGRLWAAAVPPTMPVVPVPGAQVEAWATPPAYTALPPRFLKPTGADRAASVPAGSRLVVSVTGGTGTPGVALSGGALHVDALDAHSFRAEAEIGRSGALVVTQDGVPVAAWSLTVVADAPPVAAWTAPPGPGERAARTQTRLPWHVEDDYGVVALKAELRLAARPDAPPVALPIGVPSGAAGRNAGGLAVQDLVANPWAGLDVVARLVATDAAGQAGRSADATFTLPERAFNHPVARALIAARKALSLQPEGRMDAAGLVDRLTEAPDAYDNSAGVTVELGAIAAQLRGREPVDTAQAHMWALALQLEENAAERTAQALEQAREAVREAMQAARDQDKPATTPENPASPDAAKDPSKEAGKDDPAKDAAKQALDEKLQALRDAIDRHLQALAEQARREGTDLPYDHTAPHMNQRDMDKMADATRDKARQDQMADAQKQLEQLEKLLDQLQSGRPEHGEEKAEQRRQQGRQQMGALQDMVQREGGLMDKAQARTAPAQAPAQAPVQRAPSRTPGDDGKARAGEDRQQKALRRALGELMQRFGDLTGEIPPALGEADVAMRDANDALQSGSDAGAAGAELRAIQALQKGGQQMSQQMARQFGPPQGGEGGEGEEGEGLEAENGTQDGPGNRNDAQNRDGRGGTRANPRGEYRPQRHAQTDPLGRETHGQGTNGQMESGETRVPEEMERVRTRELQEELRRREGEKTRPPTELDYIDRLLKQY